MGAGGLRAPRRKGARVAAPSGCIVPWAARASCWPQPQQLLPVSAAGSGRRCCTGAFFPAGLFGGSMLFESTRLASGKVITKQKLQYPVRILEFLVGAGGFEPPKLKSSRFTVCPHWPLGNTPKFCSRPLPDDLFILSDCGRFVNYFFRIFAAFLRKLSAGSVLGQMFPALVIPQSGNGFAGHGV